MQLDLKYLYPCKCERNIYESIYNEISNEKAEEVFIFVINLIKNSNFIKIKHN